MRRAEFVACLRSGRCHPRPRRKQPYDYDRNIYRVRNRIERCFSKLKHFRRFATRYDRRAVHFLAFIHLASAMRMRLMSIQAELGHGTLHPSN
jgi:transposase